MAEVAYLLGAGASANCVPVIENMSKDIEETIEDFLRLYDHVAYKTTEFKGKIINYEDIFNLLKDELVALQLECSNHFSIDTYAKKLFLTNDNGYSKLKATLSFYLTLKQITKKPDVRYDNFWASVLTNDVRLPKKIKVISWNYDFQLERSYMNMTNMKSLNIAQTALNMIQPIGMPFGVDLEGFTFIKLNGSARIYSVVDRDTYYLCDFEETSEFGALFRSLLFRYYLLTNYPKEFSTHLFFAWERLNRYSLEDNIKPYLLSIKVLAIIGYSFPFFNREIDIRLFNMLSNLETIYIQDCHPEIIKERLLEFLPFEGNIKLVNDVRQFVFPKELEIN